MTALLVVGGTVLAPDGPVRADVTIAEGRVTSVDSAPHDAGPHDSAPHDAGPHGAGRPATVTGSGPAGPGSTRRVDAAGLVVAPGFVDLQCNGAVGVDLTTQPERLWEVAAALPRWGVTAWLPTIVTSSPAARARARAALAADPPHSAAPAARPLGLHLEGPFLAPDRCGAHDPGLVVPPSAPLVAAEGWSRDDGVALVTLAPELPGALEVVRVLVDRDVVVAAGHSAATAAQATASVDAGIRYVTHLFNAMPPLHHREPGLAGAALADDRVHVGLIADGLHVDPAMVTLAARLLGSRLSLVTDAVAALGAPPGAVHLGGLSATVSEADGAVRLGDGTLAGSTLALDRAVRNLMAFAGVSLAEAARAVTAVPAAVLGLHDRGVIAPGAVGDLVILTPDGHVVATVVDGRVAHDTRASS